MNRKYKYLSKNVLLFSISSFLPKAISFLMIPFYTSILTPVDYGVSEIIMTTVSLFLPIFTLDIQDAVMRFVFDTKYKPNEVLSVALNLILKGIIVVFIIAFGLSLIQVSGIEKEYIIFALWQYIVLAIQNSCNFFCRGIDKVEVLTISSLINAVLNAIFNVVFLAVIPLGLIGFLLANTMSSTIALIYMVCKAKLYRYVGFKKNESLQGEMIHFSLPLIFSVIAWWINNASDRYIVTAMVSVAASGLYATAYKIPAILTVFQSVFFQAWSISAVKEFDKDDKDGFISKMYAMVNSAMAILCSLIILLNIHISHMLYSNEFFQAWEFVPPLLVAVVFNANALFVGTIYTVVKKTKILSYTTMIGALLNVVGNIIFICLMGPYGAAISTMLGYFAVMIARLVFLRRLIFLQVRWRRDCFVVLLLFVQVYLARHGQGLITIQFLVFFILLTLYIYEIKFFFAKIKIKMF